MEETRSIEPIRRILINAYEDTASLPKQLVMGAGLDAIREFGFIPAKDDVINGTFCGKKYRLRVVAREIHLDVGTMILTCHIIPEPIKPGKYESALAPFLSTDGTGRERMTLENMEKNTKPKSE